MGKFSISKPSYIGMRSGNSDYGAEQLEHLLSSSSSIFPLSTNNGVAGYLTLKFYSSLIHINNKTFTSGLNIRGLNYVY